MTLNEMARQLGITRDATKSRLHRARADPRLPITRECNLIMSEALAQDESHSQHQTRAIVERTK